MKDVEVFQYELLIEKTGLVSVEFCAEIKLKRTETFPHMPFGCGAVIVLIRDGVSVMRGVLKDAKLNKHESHSDLFLTFAIDGTMYGSIVEEFDDSEFQTLEGRKAHLLLPEEYL